MMSTLADLVRSRGRALADAELRRGAIAADMWSGIGRTVGGTLGDLARAREDTPRRAWEKARMQDDIGRINRERAIRDVGVKTQGDPEAYAREVGVIDPERGMALEAQRAAQRTAALGQLAQRVNQHKTIYGRAAQMLDEVERAPELYPQIRPQLVDLASELDPALANDIPEQYEPERVRGMLQFVVGGAEQTEKRARGLAELEAAEQATDDLLKRTTLRVDGLSKWFESADSPDVEHEIAQSARTFGIPDGIIDRARRKARQDREAQQLEQWTGGNSEYARFLRVWARDHRIPISALTAQQELQARNVFFDASRSDRTTPTNKEDPRFPRGVENYLADMKGRGYSRADAEGEVFRPDVLQKLQAAHPRISPVALQQAITRLFPDDLPGTTADGAAIFDTTPAGSARARGGRGGGSSPPPPPPAAEDGGQRTATIQEVKAVAREMGISETEAVRRLEAQGIKIRN
jgi:hypothetical protein